MSYQSYLQKCEDLLAEFEENQSRMLRLDLHVAGENFIVHIKQMRQLFKQISRELENFSFKSGRDQLLISKQIERLLVFLKEMELHLRCFFTKTLPDENKIIFIFERQHLYKNIYRKHLKDLTAIYETDYPAC
jgi:hypothetical protein